MKNNNPSAGCRLRQGYDAHGRMSRNRAIEPTANYQIRIKSTILQSSLKASWQAYHQALHICQVQQANADVLEQVH